MSGILFCRECSEGKHRNCDGTAWNNEADAPAPCTCPDPSHMSERAAAAIVDLIVADVEARKEPVIVRADRYNILIEGHTIRATDDQERRIRAMDAEQRARFLTIMGRADG